MSDNSQSVDERRRAEAVRLRAAARSTTPEAYKVAKSQQTMVDPMAEAANSYSTLFGAYFAGATHWRDHVATAMQLGAYGLAYIALILMLNLAQCSWWYEPGMYSAEHNETIGR